MLQLRNPGLITVLLFALVAGLVVFLVHGGSSFTDASKLALELLTLVASAAAAFAGKSALVVDTSKRKTTLPPPHPRNPNLITWPEMQPQKLPVINDEAPDTQPSPSREVKP